MDKINQTASIILPNQLFEKSPLFSKKNKFFLIEEFLFFNQYKFHKQKLENNLCFAFLDINPNTKGLR